MTKVGRPKQYGAARNTAETLKKSALDLFSRRNYRSVTIKDIGIEADLTTAMIYYHFKDKKELFYATMEYAIETALNQFRNVTKDIDEPVVLIRGWLHMHVVLHSEISKVLKLIIDYNQLDISSKHVDYAIELFYGTERRVLIDCITKGRDTGVFACGDPEKICVFISTFLDGAVMRTQIIDNYDISASVTEFEHMLWTILGYSAD